MVTSTALAAASGVKRRQVLVMDEVDGMSGGGGGGKGARSCKNSRQGSTGLHLACGGGWDGYGGQASAGWGREGCGGAGLTLSVQVVLGL
jgi:hypothetical protein